jgi:hypothetical protein
MAICAFRTEKKSSYCNLHTEKKTRAMQGNHGEEKENYAHRPVPGLQAVPGSDHRQTQNLGLFETKAMRISVGKR